MPEPITSITVALPAAAQPILETLTGATAGEKIARLLLAEIQRNLEACEKERLALEVKYGIDYPEFQRQLESGALGDEFGYELEQDAMRWEDLITEKQYWLQQLCLAREWVS